MSLSSCVVILTSSVFIFLILFFFVLLLLSSHSTLIPHFLPIFSSPLLQGGSLFSPSSVSSSSSSLVMDLVSELGCVSSDPSVISSCLRALSAQTLNEVQTKVRKVTACVSAISVSQSLHSLTSDLCFWQHSCWLSAAHFTPGHHPVSPHSRYRCRHSAEWTCCWGHQSRMGWSVEPAESRSGFPVCFSCYSQHRLRNSDVKQDFEKKILIIGFFLF